jgi:hypothetical protein
MDGEQLKYKHPITRIVSKDFNRLECPCGWKGIPWRNSQHDGDSHEQKVERILHLLEELEM